jgi:hypothetical protein
MREENLRHLDVVAVVTEGYGCNEHTDAHRNQGPRVPAAARPQSGLAGAHGADRERGIPVNEARAQQPFTEAIAFRVAVQLRVHYGDVVGTVYFRDGLIDLVPTMPEDDLQVEELLRCLRYLGYRAYVADGPELRIILTGENRRRL